jgi:hypothetical protein
MNPVHILIPYSSKMYFTTAIYYLDCIHRPYVLQPQSFEGWFFPRHQMNLLCWVRSTELAFIGRFHLMTREEPSLETLWLQNIRTMDKVQIIDRSNTAPSSKTFRDEMYFTIILQSASKPRSSKSLQIFRIKFCVHFSYLLCVYAHPTHLPWFHHSKQCLAKNTNYVVPHH